MPATETWAHTRRTPFLELAALPVMRNIMQWQRRLAGAIIDAEHPKTGIDRAEAKLDLHLMRVIADSLVHTLPENTTGYCRVIPASRRSCQRSAPTCSNVARHCRLMSRFTRSGRTTSSWPQLSRRQWNRRQWNRSG